mgnify:FL=1
MGHCLKHKIVLYSTKDGYAFDDSINSKVLCFAFGLVAEIERNLISMRTKEALALRKAEGKVLGRRKGDCPKMGLLVSNRKEVLKLLRRGESVAGICRRYGISRDTFRRFRLDDCEVARCLEKNIAARKGSRTRT